MSRRSVPFLLSSILILVSSCRADTETSTTTSTILTTTTQPTTTSTSAPGVPTTTADDGTTTTTTADGPATVSLFPFVEASEGWTELVFEYGEAEDLLGTSPGGEGLMLGPEYGTQTADGTWWFLDAAKRRFAHFSDEGIYLGQVPVPEELLVDGIYFQYQMPQPLDDGSLAVGGIDRPLLRLANGNLAGSEVPGNTAWATTDGRYLYGIDFDTGGLVRLDPDQPVVEPIEWVLARDGSRYRVTVIEDEVLVELPDAGVVRTLQMRFSENPDVIVRGGIEVETGADGTLFGLLYGIPMIDEPLDVAALVTIAGDGAIGAAEPVVALFSPSDPGSPARLGVTPGTSQPWLMVVGEDALRVYRRAG